METTNAATQETPGADQHATNTFARLSATIRELVAKRGPELTKPDDARPSPKVAEAPPEPEPKRSGLTDERIAAKRAEQARREAELDARDAATKAKKARLDAVSTELSELARLRTERPAEFVKRLTGSSLLDLLRRAHELESDPAKAKTYAERMQVEELKHQAKELEAAHLRQQAEVSREQGKKNLADVFVPFAAEAGLTRAELRSVTNRTYAFAERFYADHNREPTLQEIDSFASQFCPEFRPFIEKKRQAATAKTTTSKPTPAQARRERIAARAPKPGATLESKIRAALAAQKTAR